MPGAAHDGCRTRPAPALRRGDPAVIPACAAQAQPVLAGGLPSFARRARYLPEDKPTPDPCQQPRWSQPALGRQEAPLLLAVLRCPLRTHDEAEPWMVHSPRGARSQPSTPVERTSQAPHRAAGVGLAPRPRNTHGAHHISLGRAPSAPPQAGLDLLGLGCGIWWRMVASFELLPGARRSLGTRPNKLVELSNITNLSEPDRLGAPGTSTLVMVATWPGGVEAIAGPTRCWPTPVTSNTTRHGNTARVFIGTSAPGHNRHDKRRLDERADPGQTRQRSVSWRRQRSRSASSKRASTAHGTASQVLPQPRLEVPDTDASDEESTATGPKPQGREKMGVLCCRRRRRGVGRAPIAERDGKIRALIPTFAETACHGQSRGPALTSPTAARARQASGPLRSCPRIATRVRFNARVTRRALDVRAIAARAAPHPRSCARWDHNPNGYPGAGGASPLARGARGVDETRAASRLSLRRRRALPGSPRLPAPGPPDGSPILPAKSGNGRWQWRRHGLVTTARGGAAPAPGSRAS